MHRYVTFTPETGQILGFYSDVDHGPRQIQVPDPNWKAPKGKTAADAPVVTIDNPDTRIPVDAIEITDKAWQAALSRPLDFKVVKDKLTDVSTAKTRLVGIKNRVLVQIDGQAVNARQVISTQGMDALYTAKRTEAQRFATTNEVDPASFPLLAAEIGITAPDLAGVAQVVNANATVWAKEMAKIEQIRLQAKKTVREAKTAEEVESVYKAIAWPSQG